jgi:hypothetical protein
MQYCIVTNVYKKPEMFTTFLKSIFDVTLWIYLPFIRRYRTGTKIAQHIGVLLRNNIFSNIFYTVYNFILKLPISWYWPKDIHFIEYIRKQKAKNTFGEYTWSNEVIARCNVVEGRDVGLMSFCFVGCAKESVLRLYLTYKYTCPCIQKHSRPNSILRE